MSHSPGLIAVPALTLLAVLELAGCATPSNSPPSASPPPGAVVSATTGTGSVGSTEGSATGAKFDTSLVTERGDRLNPQAFGVLVLGNTLYRPLENGVQTLIYIAPDGAEQMRISNSEGQSATDTGRQTMKGSLACWQWNKVGGGQPMCFEYFWNGRVLTMVDSSGATQPAQFLIKKGREPGI